MSLSYSFFAFSIILCLLFSFFSSVDFSTLNLNEFKVEVSYITLGVNIGVLSSFNIGPGVLKLIDFFDFILL